MTGLWLREGKLYVGAGVSPVVRAVDPPRLWVKVFHHTLLVEPPSHTLDRVDVVFLQGPLAMIRYGQPALDLQPPGLPDGMADAEVLAHIRVRAAATAITPDDITLVDHAHSHSEGTS